MPVFIGLRCQVLGGYVFIERFSHSEGHDHDPIAPTEYAVCFLEIVGRGNDDGETPDAWQ